MRIVPLTAISVLCLLEAASAEGLEANLPALFDVTGVAASDVLNVRSEPTAAGRIVGTLESDAERVEVVDLSDNGRWALVNVAETSGYVAVRYLEPREIEHGPDGLPSKLSCFGTEPFWSLAFDEGTLSLATPEDGEQSLSLDRVFAMMNRPQPNHVILAHQGETAYIGVIGRAECSDGMSDRRYGLEITFIEDSTHAWAASGCCSLR